MLRGPRRRHPAAGAAAVSGLTKPYGTTLAPDGVSLRRRSVVNPLITIYGCVNILRTQGAQGAISTLSAWRSFIAR